MKLSDKDKKPDNGMGGFLSNSPVYSLLALYMPLSILTALFFLLRAFLPIPFPMTILFIFGCLTALTASFYCDFMKDIKSSRTAANIRGGLIVMGILYILSSLFVRGIPWRLRFLPNLTNILVSLEALYLWVSIISLKKIFATRRYFESYTKLYRGDELQKTILENATLMEDTNRNIIKVRRNYQSQLILISIIVFIGVYFLKATVSPALYFLLAVILMGGICVSAFFGIMRWEHYHAGEGLALSAVDRFKHLFWIGGFAIVSIIAAALLSSNKSILPSYLITGFFGWLLGLFRRSTNAGEMPPEQFNQMEFGQRPNMPRDLSMENAVPSPLWDLLKYGFIAIILTLFIWFMISPLLDREYNPNRLSFLRRLQRIIAELFKGIKNILASLVYNLKNKTYTKKLRKPQAGEIRRTAEFLFGAYSPAKKSDMRRSVTLFARLIIWGSDVRQVIWKPSHAPGEYCRILSTSAVITNETQDSFAVQRINEGIIRCGEIFEKALYSAEVLSNEERKEFKNLIKKITSFDT